MKIINIFDKKLIKFLLVGIINTLIGAGVMFILYNCFNCSYWLSSAANYIVGGIVSFILNKFFTFQNSSKSIRQILLFILTVGFCYFMAYVLAKQLVFFIFFSYSDKIKDNISMFLGMFLYTGLNYLIQRFIVFKENTDNEDL